MVAIKVFMLSSNLKRHKFIVHSEKRYICDINGCDQSLRTLTSLKDHKNRHLNVKTI